MTVSATPSQAPVPESGPSSSAAESSLTHKASTGFLWMTAQAVVSKFLSSGGQIVLAWLLRPKDFGVIGLAFTVTGIAGVIQRLGLETILIQRQASFSRWVSSVFWMSLIASCMAALLMICAAPLGAMAFESRQVGWLVVILALAAPLNALAIVPSADLQIHFRFQALSMIALIQAGGTLALSILLAWRGFGAYSFAIPVPVMAAVRAAWLWGLSPTGLTGRFDWRRCRRLLRDGAFLIGIGLSGAIVGNGDNITLGLTQRKEAVGIYIFAFNLSTQTIAMITFNVASVLLPALSGLQAEPARMGKAFLRAARVLAIISVPLCLMQAAAAGPILRLLFAPRWAPAIPVLQVLSLGMALCLMGGPTASLLQAQGRFAFLFGWSAWSALAFVGFVAVGAAFGGIVHVAIAVALFYAIACPVSLYLATKPVGGSAYEVWRVFGLPMALGVAALVGPFAAAQTFSTQTRAGNLAACAVIGFGGLLIYLPLVRVFAAEEYLEMKTRVVALLGSARARR